MAEWPKRRVRLARPFNDRLCTEARREGRPTRAPTDLGEPISYGARIADPDGNSLELSLGQEVGIAVGRPAKR
jgi:hypothetical protein